MPSGDNYMDFHLDYYAQSQGAMIMTPKTLHNSDISGTRVNVKDVRVVGNGDTVITASIEAASTGDERRAAASK